MASTFTWLDYSEEQRRKALEFLADNSEHDTRDELGLGTVRDGFADLFFPGTSTIQTRARYFLFVPWIYLDLERRRIDSSHFATKARQAEVGLIPVLAASEDNTGTVGVVARDRLQRLPSAIYWQGLERWGIRLVRASQDSYHRSVDAYYRSIDHSPRNDDKEPVSGHLPQNWHAGLPAAPPEFPRHVSLRLLQPEAAYLRERILTRAPGSLLAFLVDRSLPTVDAPFFWIHPQRDQFPDRTTEQVEHARNFSEAMHGSALLYNLMLAELVDKGDLVASYRTALGLWSESLRGRESELLRWQRKRFWEIVLAAGARLTTPTRAFVDGWLDLVLKDERPAGIANSPHARDLVLRRERQLKRGQARLDNQRARERWTGAAGTAQLDYRWRIAQRIVSDILAGMGREVPGC